METNYEKLTLKVSNKDKRMKIIKKQMSTWHKRSTKKM